MLNYIFIKYLFLFDILYKKKIRVSGSSVGKYIDRLRYLRLRDSGFDPSLPSFFISFYRWIEVLSTSRLWKSCGRRWFKPARYAWSENHGYRASKGPHLRPRKVKKL